MKKSTLKITPQLRKAIAIDQIRSCEFHESLARQGRKSGDYEPHPDRTFRQLVGAVGHRADGCHGERGWVLARRSPNILARYGEDVVCLSSQAYDNAERVAKLLVSEGFD